MSGKKRLNEALLMGKIEAFSSLEQSLNLIAFTVSLVILGLVAAFAPGGMIKWWAMAAFVLVWMPLAHYGYGFYDELTVEKR